MSRCPECYTHGMCDCGTDWKSKCEELEESLSVAEAEVTKLTAQLKTLQDSFKLFKAPTKHISTSWPLKEGESPLYHEKPYRPYHVQADLYRELIAQDTVEETPFEFNIPEERDGRYFYTHELLNAVGMDMAKGSDYTVEANFEKDEEGNWKVKGVARRKEESKK